MLHHVEASIPVGGAVSLPDAANLFTLINATDMSTLYQDSAKTTPVTSVGDTVGAIADLSGNGNDFLQPTAAYCGTYSTSASFGDCVLCYSHNQRKGYILANVPAQPRTIYVMMHRHSAVLNNDMYVWFGPPYGAGWNDHIKGSSDANDLPYDRTYDAQIYGSVNLGYGVNANPRIYGFVKNGASSKFFSHAVWDNTNYNRVGYTGSLYYGYHPAYTNPVFPQYLAAFACYSAAHDEATASAVIAYLESITGYSFP